MTKPDIMAEVSIHIYSWRDRLRVLFAGHVDVRISSWSTWILKVEPVWPVSQIKVKNVQENSHE